jgi:CRP-like cAMP-binding protein
MVYRVGVGHITRFLQDVDIFRGLSDRHLERVAALCNDYAFSEGDYLTVQDEPGDRLYVIQSGSVTATTGRDGARVVVRTVRERETFPVAALFEPPILITTTRAAVDGSALVIPRVNLMELCEIEPTIGLHIYRAACSVLSNRYRYALHRLEDSMTSPVQLDPHWSGTEI